MSLLAFLLLCVIGLFIAYIRYEAIRASAEPPPWQVQAFRISQFYYGHRWQVWLGGLLLLAAYAYWLLADGIAAYRLCNQADIPAVFITCLLAL